MTQYFIGGQGNDKIIFGWLEMGRVHTFNIGYYKKYGTVITLRDKCTKHPNSILINAYHLIPIHRIELIRKYVKIKYSSHLSIIGKMWH